MELLNLSGESVREHKPADRVTIAVSTVWVELASSVSRRNVELCQVTGTSDLNVIGCLDEVGSLNGAVGHETRTGSRLQAPGDFEALSLSNDRVCSRLRRSEQAEVIDRVDVRVLTHRRLLLVVPQAFVPS